MGLWDPVHISPVTNTHIDQDEFIRKMLEFERIEQPVQNKLNLIGQIHKDDKVVERRRQKELERKQNSRIANRAKQSRR